jgi:hypothetical protein
MHRPRSLAGLLLAPVLALAIAAPVAAADEAMVRVLHASPDAPAVDIKVDDTDVLTNVPFETISDYLPLAAGTYNIKVCATGTDTCVIDADLTFAANTKYTVAATNVLASIEAQVLTDTPAPTADAAQVRVIHFSADTPAVDVLTQDGATTVVDALAYPNATDYLSLPGGSYDLKVCADADNSVCPLDPGALAISNGTAYSVFAIGSLQGGSLTAVVAVDATAPAPTAAPTSAPPTGATPPPTDTAPLSEGSSEAPIPVIALFLGLAASGVAIVSRAVKPRRVPQD